MPRILYIQYTNPAGYPPLQHSSRALAQAGWEVLFLGTETRAGDDFRFPPHPRIAVRLVPFCPAGWRQKLHCVRFALRVLACGLRWEPQWVYVSDPLACPAGWLVSWLPGIRLVYHEHDSPVAVESRFMRFVLSMRRRLARRAEFCVLPNQQRADVFAAAVGQPSPVLCVWNCPAREEISSPRPALNGTGLAVLYHGSIVPARLPLTVIQALAQLPEQVRLRIIGYETDSQRSYLAELRELAQKLGVERRVEIVPAMPRHQLMELCRQSDVGLAFMPLRSEDLNEQAMVGASNKPFDYLACGLALLVSDLPEWRALYVTSGHGLAVDPQNTASLATAIRWLLDHPAETRAMGERGRQRIAAEWNYETQFSPVLERLTA